MAIIKNFTLNYIYLLHLKTILCFLSLVSFLSVLLPSFVVNIAQNGMSKQSGVSLPPVRLNADLVSHPLTGDAAGTASAAAASEQPVRAPALHLAQVRDGKRGGPPPGARGGDGVVGGEAAQGRGRVRAHGQRQGGRGGGRGPRHAPPR